MISLHFLNCFSKVLIQWAESQGRRKDERKASSAQSKVYLYLVSQHNFYIEEAIENVEVSFATNGHFKKWNFITFSEVHRAFDSCSVTKCREIYEMQHLAFYQPYKQK